MKTSQEALFVAMMNNGWFCQTEGEVESPAGFFGWVSNEKSELASIRNEFAETIEAYGDPSDGEIIGHYTLVVNDQGQTRIVKWDSETDARKAFDRACAQHESWVYD